MRSRFMAMTLSVLFVALTVILTTNSSYLPQVSAATPAPTLAATTSMDGGMTMGSPYSTNDLAPLAKAYYGGKDVYFIHPETSDPDVAAVLTKMMGPKVLTVPSLAKVSKELLGNVYVFTNGLKGMGPLGFQPDVFDSVPGDTAYTPLRAITLVTWKKEADAKELKSVADIKQAESAGVIETKQPGVVVNMPVLVWPDGKR